MGQLTERLQEPFQAVDPKLTGARACDWHALSPDDVAARLQTGTQGLTTGEAGARLARHGPNSLPAPRRAPAWRVFAAQFRSLLVVILIVAAVASLFLGSTVEAVAIIVIVLLASLLGFAQEYRAERAIDALRQMSAPNAVVIRDGSRRTVSSLELVPGDVMALQAGQRIAADARLLQQFNLRTDESPLTGESSTVAKSADAVCAADVAVADRSNMVYAGSTVARGRGRALVVATGAATEFGRIAGLLRTVEVARTPLQRNLDRIGRVLAAAAAVIVLAIVALGLLRGESLINMVVFGIALAVAAVPEALPAVVTLSLALGVQRMIRRNALVRFLPSVETLGSTSVICADKTGTLTRDEMTVRELVVAGSTVSVTGSGLTPEGEFRWPAGIEPQADLLAELLTAAVLCSDARLEQLDGQWTVVGDPTEGALIVAAAKAGLDRRALKSAAPRVDETPFDSGAKYMLTHHRSEHGEDRYCKGAPEVVVDMCKAHRVRGGRSGPLDDRSRAAILDQAGSMASRALRVLALARRGPGDEDFVFLGLAGMKDPPRDETAGAIERCRVAGIRTVMITGDHPDTARAIAAEIGLRDGGRIVTGVELDEIDEAGLAAQVNDIDVYARVSPEHKLRVIDAWQRNGKVVAMTGDGVNDAPALKKADIGIAMGITGTDVAREAAAMTLLDDNFASIVGAVEEGRAIFSNIRKYLVYLLSANIGEIGLLAAATAAGLPLPLTAVQILYINLATDGLPALALSVDPPDKDLMRVAPRDPRGGIFSRDVLTLILSGGAWSMLVNLGLFAGLLQAGRSLQQAMAMTFVSLVLIQFFTAYCLRTADHHIIRQPFANRWLNLAIVWELALLGVVVYAPLLHAPLSTFALSLSDWAIVVPVAASVIPVLELAKVFARRVRS